jgi:anhydro-N-acetylmuramic acid kinase
MPKPYLMIGLMSGSSLDGLDAALCSFETDGTGHWSGHIMATHSSSFSSALEQSLRNARTSSALELMETDAAFVRFSAEAVQSLNNQTGIQPLAIASHGHTVFHHPTAGYTTQIGNGGLLSGLTGLPVVSDFRTLDVGLGGQGAPLVPGAEKFLFASYDACLNLGGICNISFPKQSPFLGFDIAPCNQLLNLAASWIGLDYDPEGQNAAQGQLIPELMDELEALPYYGQPYPKSLGNEDVARTWIPVCEKWRHRPQDVMHTVCIHAARQIARSVTPLVKNGKMLVTGGGAFHDFLIRMIREELGDEWAVEIPARELISFKEAYCFAFLGLKRILNEPNCFAEVTGAKTDSVCGALYGTVRLPN